MIDEHEINSKTLDVIDKAIRTYEMHIDSDQEREQARLLVGRVVGAVMLANALKKEAKTPTAKPSLGRL